MRARAEPVIKGVERRVVGNAVPAEAFVAEISGIEKRFGENVVLDRLSLSVAPGAIIGLVGPNGAGKTTLLNIMAGITPADAGTVVLEAEKVDFDRRPEARRLLGLMLGGRMLVEDLRPSEYFSFLSAMHGLDWRSLESELGPVLSALRLTEHFDKPIKVLSAGTRKKVEFVGAILHRPRLLLLDEPFEAIDPPAVHELTEAVRQFVEARGAGAVISSHILPYVRPLASEILLLWKGQMYEQRSLLRLLEAAQDDADLQTWGSVLAVA